MKRVFRPAAAILLSLSLLVSLVPGARASYAMGSELHQAVNELGPGVSLTTQSLWSASRSDLRTERYLTYTPTGLVTPTVVYGDAVWSKGNLTKMAQRLEADGHRVLGGANGDYFVMATGEPLGSLVTDGILRSGSPFYAAVGFRADGTAMVGMPRLQFWADIHGYHLISGGGYNKSQRENTSYAIFNSDLGGGTRRTGNGTDVILRPVVVPADYRPPVLTPTLDPVTGVEVPPTQAEQDAALAASVAGFETLPAQLTIGGKITCVVEKVWEGKPLDVPAGRFVISLADPCDDFLKSELKSLRVGEQVTLSVTAGDSQWNEAVTLIGAFEQIVEDGKEVAKLTTSAAPRTALGIRADGTVILYTMDGRQAGYSVGAGVDQVARRLIELGCVNAVLFDGGGSTTLGTTGLLEQNFSVNNRPSDGGLRAVTNALFFVSDLPKTGEPGSFYVTPQDGILLAGAKKNLSGWAIDTNYHPLYPVTGGLTYTVDGPGTVEGNVFTAGGKQGTAVVTATTPSGAAGSAHFTVVETPSAITVTNEQTGQKVESLNLEPGQQVNLHATSVWWTLPVESQDECYTWAVSGGLAAAGADGTITAGAAAGAGTLTVSAGTRVVSIPMSIVSHVNTLHSMEGDLSAFQSGTAQLSPVTGDGSVIRGKGALAADYPLGSAAEFSCDLAIQPGELYLGLWARGTGTAATLTARLGLADGSETQAVVFQEAFQGWKQFFIPLPGNAVKLTGFTISEPEDAQGAKLTGRLVLDHLVTANAPIYDTVPPKVTATVSGGQVSATISDDVDKTFTKEQVRVTYDGVEVDFVLRGTAVAATLPAADGGLHRVSVLVRDASGNCARGTAEIAPDAGHPTLFADTQGHWAGNYITYLREQGIANGEAQPDGSYCYYPGRNITRAEFAALLARWSRVDLNQYSGTALPFADGAAIPAWAMPEIRALYALGIFNGSKGADGIYANPGASITRGEAMTMLGRAMEKGYAPSATQFSDHAQIPSWAAEHVYTLAGLGVVSGDQGGVRAADPVTRAEVAKMLANMW